MITTSKYRIRAEIAVRIFGMDTANKPFNKLAHTIEIGDTGVRLGGVVVGLNPDDIIGVQNNARKARFRVVSAATPESQETAQVELDCLQPEKEIWGDLERLLSASAPPEAQAEQTSPDGLGIASAAPGDRRSFPRYKCEIGAVVQPTGGADRYWGRCTDISLGGCYVETWSPLPIGSKPVLQFEEMEIQCSVTTCHPGVGMGLHFEKVSDPHRLEDLVAKIATPDPAS